MINEDSLQKRKAAILPHLDERQRRLFAAAEAKAAGHGGIAAVSRVTRIAASTIGRDLVTTQVVWLAHARRRDLAKSDGSRDRASMMFQPCFLAETKERISAKSIAPCNDRKPPEIF